MNKKIIIPILLTSTIIAIGCGDGDKWNGKNCSTAGNTTVCVLHKKDGTTCQVVKKTEIAFEDSTTSTCDSPIGTEGMTCNDEYSNNSGNICKVDMGNGVVCVAVLPDGGKSPKDYKDFVTCPSSKEAGE